MKVIIDPTPTRIFLLLFNGELTVSDLVEVLGQNQLQISLELKLLSEVGLIEHFGDGNGTFYGKKKSSNGIESATRLWSTGPRNVDLIRYGLERLLEVKCVQRESAAACFCEPSGNWDQIKSLNVDAADVEKRPIEQLSRHHIYSIIHSNTETGYLLRFFGLRLNQGEGIEQSYEIFTVARTTSETAFLSHCQVRQERLYNLPNPVSSSYLIISYHALHFIDDQARAIHEVKCVLKSDEQLVVVNFAFHDLKYLCVNDNHRCLEFSEAEVEACFVNAKLALKPSAELADVSLAIDIWIYEKLNVHGQN